MIRSSRGTKVRRSRVCARGRGGARGSASLRDASSTHSPASECWGRPFFRSRSPSSNPPVSRQPFQLSPACTQRPHLSCSVGACPATSQGTDGSARPPTSMRQPCLGRERSRATRLQRSLAAPGSPTSRAVAVRPRRFSVQLRCTCSGPAPKPTALDARARIGYFFRNSASHA